MFGEINAGISLWERVSKWWERRKNPPAESIATRFVRLFETHGVHRNQIPRFIGHGLTLKDVQDDASLFAKLDESLLEAACAKFAVRREWLDGAETQVHPCRDFYKYPEKFQEFLEQLMSENPDGDFQGVLIAPSGSSGHDETLLILQETVGAVGEKPIYRFHICHNWYLTYWKARAYLTACIAVAWKRHVFVYGTFLSRKEIAQMSEGTTLLGWNGEGIWALGRREWYPEDMALDPATFLNGVDPELENFGIKSSLELWLDLEQQGYMDIGINSTLYPNPKQSFQKELNKYN